MKIEIRLLHSSFACDSLLYVSDDGEIVVRQRVREIAAIGQLHYYVHCVRVFRDARTDLTIPFKWLNQDPSRKNGNLSDTICILCSFAFSRFKSRFATRQTLI
jgi:hypothetical protein